MAAKFENMLLVSGSGRNVGKTTFICRIITQNTAKKIVAIKITPHFHKTTFGLIPLHIAENYTVYEEIDRFSDKDTSLFLQAGAKRVFFIQAKDDQLEAAFGIVSTLIDPEQPVIIESAALRKIRVPNLYIFIQKKFETVKPSAHEMQKLADISVFSEEESFSIDPQTIQFNLTWKIHDHVAASH
ncbi:MAG TPA: hypothetical protein DHV48_06760 [Prolixibacteraceae bacterium]|nr:hypothetical protein [Prolixibacteraceae bacterium]